MSIFHYFKNRILMARVAAELKAQCGDQVFVDKVCFSYSGSHIIRDLANQRFTKPEKFRYFMIVKFFLAETMRTYDASIDVKAACLELLNERRGRIQGGINRGQIGTYITEEDIAELDAITDIGISVYQSERRHIMGMIRP